VTSNLRMARGCQTYSTKVLFRQPPIKSTSRHGFYSESTIFPGAVPVENGAPLIKVGAPVDVL
jgi:hypothetical protein